MQIIAKYLGGTGPGEEALPDNRSVGTGSWWVGFPQNSLLDLFPGTQAGSQIKVGICCYHPSQNNPESRAGPEETILWSSQGARGTATGGVTLSPFAFSSNGFKPASTTLRRLKTLL